MAINDNNAGVKELSDGGSDGFRLGSTSTSEIAFLGATPVARRASTTDLKDLLVTFGFLTDSGATPLNLDGGDATVDNVAATTGTITTLTSTTATLTTATITDATLGNDLTINDAGNIILKATTGTIIGTATTQKLGFFAKTPVVQPVGTSQGAAANGTTTTATTTNLDTGLTNLRVLVHKIRTDLIALGLIKGAA